MDVGDKVKIVNYGCLVWERKNGDTPPNPIYETEYIYAIDVHRELVGKESVVTEVKKGYTANFYKLENMSGYYSEIQLEKL